ncbi:sulfatase [Pedobacter sp. SD-b]|uniref:Sulfatase n=1 Tax=Pedobacter segetis TaxID=2793069 RepID=A0ABS1BL64_9SPHI|nr:sulfatase [Pedobacter segetis]MBK0383630.1 sulfatase [Pedobacter segetis]
MIPKLQVKIILSFLTILFFCLRAEAQQKPNILWVVIEDTSPQFIGCYGDKTAKTPNIDELAKKGVRFTNAFSTGTVCSPSRSTIITGARTFEMGTGNHRSQYPIPDFIAGFPTYLRKAGYYTSNNYKKDYNTSSQEKITKQAWDESSKTAGWWNRKSGQPFFAVFNFMGSHQSRTMTNPYDVYVKQVLDTLPKALQTGDNDFKVPPIFKDTPEMRHQLARIYNGISLTDYNIGKILNRLKKDNLMDSTIIFFYADHGEAMPKGKTNGIDLGHRVPFVVYFPEMYKNLSPFGTGGVVTDQLIDFADLAPTLLNLAGADVPAYMHGRNFLGKNSAPEAKQLLLSSDGSEGASNVMRTITNGKMSYSRAFMPFMPQMFYEKYFDFSDILQQMRKDFKNNSLSEIQKQMFETGTTEYLYDYDKDPWQTNNLAKDPRYKNLIEKMREDLKDSIIKNKDVMFLPGYELDQVSKNTTPYEFRLNTKDYPIADIYKAASLSGIKTETALKQQLALLHHANKIVRYWAALGLKSQGSKLQNYKKEILNSSNDSYMPVRIILASICYDHFLNQQAKQILIKTLSLAEEEKLQLLTLQMLIYQQNNKEFIPNVEELLAQKSTKPEAREVSELFLYVVKGTPLHYTTFW